MTEPVQVLLESGCPEEERAAVATVFEEAGIPAEVHGAILRRSAGLAPWLVDIEVGVKFLVAAAATGFGLASGTDGWQGLKRVVQSLYKAREGSGAPEGGVTLRDPEASVEITLPRDLADEAYRRLNVLEDPHAPLSGTLVWNSEKQEWTDALEGKLRCEYPGCPASASQARLHRPVPGVILRRTFCDRHAAAADLDDPQAWSE
jgi:hypothetical protein